MRPFKNERDDTTPLYIRFFLVGYRYCAYPSGLQLSTINNKKLPRDGVLVDFTIIREFVPHGPRIAVSAPFRNAGGGRAYLREWTTTVDGKRSRITENGSTHVKIRLYKLVQPAACD